MRTLFVAGNWKINPGTAEAAVTLAEEVKAGVGQAVAQRDGDVGVGAQWQVRAVLLGGSEGHHEQIGPGPHHW